MAGLPSSCLSVWNLTSHRIWPLGLSQGQLLLPWSLPLDYLVHSKHTSSHPGTPPLLTCPLFIALTTVEIIRTLALDILSWHLERPPGRATTFPVRYLGRTNMLMCVYGWPPCIFIIPRCVFMCHPALAPASLSNNGAVCSFLICLLHFFSLFGLHRVLSHRRLVAGCFPRGQFSPNVSTNAKANNTHCVI